MPTPDTPVGKLKNIGPVGVDWLEAVGIYTYADLQKAGAVMAYKILQHHHRGVNMLMLYSLHGALNDKHWNALTKEEKERLRNEANGDLEVSFGD